MMTLLKTVFLATWLLVGTHGARKLCESEDPMMFENGCTEVGGRLVIRDIADDAVLVKKLQYLKRVNKGIEVIETELDELKCLENVEEIRNENGPALLFKGNSRLKRLHMKNLRKLNGLDLDIVFENDHFPKAAYESADSMSDLLHLERVSRETHKDREHCSPEFFRVDETDEPSGTPWLLYVLAALNGIAAIGIIVQVFFFLKQKKQKDKKKASGGEEGAEANDEKQGAKEGKKIKGGRKKGKKENGGERAKEKNAKEE